jgi:ATP-dependent Lon protease
MNIKKEDLQEILVSDESLGSDLVPIITEEDEARELKNKIPDEIPVLIVKNTVLFPGMVMPLTIGRNKSTKLIKDAEAKNLKIGVFSQRDASIENPEYSDINDIGTLANVGKKLQLPDGSTMVIIRGTRKIKIDEFTSDEPYFKAKVSEIKEDKVKNKAEFKALVDSIRDTFVHILDLSPQYPPDASEAVYKINNNKFLLSYVASNLDIDVPTKQEILEENDLYEKAEKILEILYKEEQMLELKDEIQSKVRGDLDKQQKEYFLQQQMRAIQEELGHGSPDKEIENLREKGKRKKWGKEVSEQFNKELDKLMRMNPATPDYSVSMNYAQLLLSLPWNEFTKDSFDIKNAQKILDKDHFGLEKVKERILEYLAVIKLKGNMKSPIICLYGPPGVGKTSLGKSIAKSIGRKYARISLGGLHDEAELRGHRKTYIGAMPGRIIQNLKKAKSSNPVFVLDEIDKIGNDFRGDPSSALLEILDPEQNNTFYDNYVELDYDLSNVMFIATANRLDTIQPALLDRMEIIDLSGYTIEEKSEIAQKYLIPKQREAHGLTKKNFRLNKKVVEKIIDEYTRESGVRTLEKRIAAVARATTKKIVMEQEYNNPLTADDVEKILGTDKMERETYEDNSVAGIVPGLAWSQSGGSILYVESSLSKGKGRVVLTGQLGDVMKESATTALSFLKAHSKDYGIDSRVFDQWDVHIHFPAGAIPKDGPSAGITILTSLTSLFTQKKVKKNLALTGEITLRGLVLPVGGIKEKILAAKRANIKEIILSIKNKKDIEDINPTYIQDLKFHYVEKMSEVLDKALTKQKVDNPIEFNIEEKVKS